MSLHLEFEPHSWYKGFAIKNNREQGHDQSNLERPLDNNKGHKWSAYTDDGNTYRIIELHDDTLEGLKRQIRINIQLREEKMRRIYEAVS